MDANEIQRLAAMGAALRPDWPARSLGTFIERNLGARAYGDVAVALAWVAARTKTETPRLLLEAGPWWKAAAGDSHHTPRPPRKAEECQTHPGNWRESCHGCAADGLAGDQTAPADPRRPDGGAPLDRIRAELRSTRSNLCSHGVRTSQCAEHREERA